MQEGAKRPTECCECVWQSWMATGSGKPMRTAEAEDCRLLWRVKIAFCHILHHRSKDGGEKKQAWFNRGVRWKSDGLNNLFHLGRARFQTYLLILNVRQYRVRGSDFLSSRFPFVPSWFTNHVSRNEQQYIFQKIIETSQTVLPNIQ